MESENDREVYEDGTVNDGGASAHDCLPVAGRTDGRVPGGIKPIRDFSGPEHGVKSSGCLTTLLGVAGITFAGTVGVAAYEVCSYLIR